MDLDGCCHICRGQLFALNKQLDEARAAFEGSIGHGISLADGIKYLREECDKLHAGTCGGRDFEDAEIRRLSTENRELKEKIKTLRKKKQT